MSLFISILYIHLIRYVGKQKKKFINKNQKYKKISMKGSIFILTFLNVSTWAPFSVLGKYDFFFFK